MPDADPLLEIADDLYALPLADFTPARDALVKEHKADKALAASIKGLRKASPRRGWSTCWCVATPTRSTRCSPWGRPCARRRRTSTPPSCGSSPSSAAS